MRLIRVDRLMRVDIWTWERNIDFTEDAAFYVVFFRFVPAKAKGSVSS